MECNRDEALRAKGIAENKFQAKDITGARKFALKAQTLYPDLEGISQLLTTLEVYNSAEEKINGESNWYSILGVSPQSDDETIRKQYRKRALLLHPDKNRSIGAEGAFKLVSQAWSLLSDKSRKLAYDQKNSTANGGPPPPTTMQNGFYNFAKNAASQMKVPKGDSSKRDVPPGPAPSRNKGQKTFWTVCHRCKMQYEYLRMYLNQYLLCPNCHEAYLATEIQAPPANRSRTSTNHQTSNSRQGQQGNNSAGHNSATPHARGSANDFQWAPFSESNGAASAIHAANMVQQAYAKVRRERQKATAATKKEERKNHASKRAVDGRASKQLNDVKRRKGAEDYGTNKNTMPQVHIENKMIDGSLTTGNNKPNGAGNMDIRELLMKRAQDEIHKKLNVLSSVNVDTASTGGEANGSQRKNETGKEEDPNVMGDQSKSSGLVEQIPCKKFNCGADGESMKQILVDVPDSDIYDFDINRLPRYFEHNQIWAIYDNDDGMPRYYAMIHKVISMDPFQVEISWLKSQTNEWFSSGFSKACGDFKIGRREICNSSDSFSHKVRWKKGTQQTVQIVPQKGDVWALYRNWSVEWNELTEHEVIHKYDLVEVLEDYDEELGVVVIPLVKVAGFKTVFRQHVDPSEIRRISREEMPRFSHQVPSHLLTGQKGPDLLKGCCELDPAATPSELLEVVAMVEENEGVKITGEMDTVKVARNGKITKGEEIMESCEETSTSCGEVKTSSKN